MEYRFSLDNAHEIATLFWKEQGEANVFAFHGEMGAGKTTFIHALCDVKKVQDVVGSPTFSIINEYAYNENGAQRMIYHIDLYRLKDDEEAVRAGVEDCLYSDHVCMVEWPEKAPRIFPPDTVHIYIEPVDNNIRKLTIANK
jgi:tRNA threonylcarbamoyladenosine biosynthesis protein TsaE